MSIRECCFKTGLVLGTGLLTATVGSGAGAFAAKMLGLETTIDAIHGLVSGFSFGGIAKFADLVLPNGEEGRCHQISAWCLGFASGTGVGYGVLKAVGMGLKISRFASLAGLTSVVGITALLGIKVAYNAWKNRECRRRTIKVNLPGSPNSLLKESG